MRSRPLRLCLILASVLFVAPVCYVVTKSTPNASDVLEVLEPIEARINNSSSGQATTYVDYRKVEALRGLKKKIGVTSHFLAFALRDEQRLICLESYNLYLSVKIRSTPVPLRVADAPVYGYHRSCPNSGYLFDLADNELLEVTIVGDTSRLPPRVSIIVAPCPDVPVKDLIVSADLDSRMGFAAVLLAVLGIALFLGAAVWQFIERKK